MEYNLSGGTTDFLYVSPDERGLSITRIGGSSDISAGQFIDRVGVAMGLSFPAGSAIDTLAQQYSSVVRGAPVFYKSGEISFSGPESQAQRYMAEKSYDMTKWLNGHFQLFGTGWKSSLISAVKEE